MWCGPTDWFGARNILIGPVTSRISRFRCAFDSRELKLNSGLKLHADIQSILTGYDCTGSFQWCRCPHSSAGLHLAGKRNTMMRGLCKLMGWHHPRCHNSAQEAITWDTGRRESPCFCGEADNVESQSLRDWCECAFKLRLKYRKCRVIQRRRMTASSC